MALARVCSGGPATLRAGIVSLIFKKGDPEDLSNWRPITMCNTDFEIFALIIKNRLATVLHELIGEYQTCGVAGRSIYDNLRFLRDNLEPGVEGALLKLDQESAFPNVDHGYLFAALGAFGFPSRFISLIHLLYKNVFVCVNFEGGLTNRIPFQKEVRQGDPMASSLCILCLEPCLRKLARRMREIAPSPFPSAPDTNLSTYTQSPSSRTRSSFH